MMSAEGVTMAETVGGLVKLSIQFTREELAWLRVRRLRKGQASLASVVREVIDAAMEADEQPAERRAS